MSATAESLPMHVPPSNNLRPLLLLVGVALAVAAGVAIALWSRESSYGLLVAKVSNAQAAQIVQTLEGSGIPHRVEGGSVLVPTERLSEARLKLASQGLGGNDGGFDDLQKDPGFGVSQFMETARYQHALETELGQTIANLQPIEGARVHLALPRQSAFVRDRRSASASVFVQLKAGRRLAEEQINSIVNLVASSVPEMEVSQVTVVDQQGRLLSAPHGNDEYAMRDKQFEFAHRLEEVYSQRVEQLLSALVGTGRVRAQVVADVEMSISEEAREQFKPQSQVVRSEQQAEESSRNGSGPQGVPGALTNQPPQGGVALPPGANASANANANAAASAQNASATGENSSSKQSTRNYEIDRTLAYTKQPPGTLKRLSVAVLVDNTRTVGDDGTEKQTPLSAEQIANMTRLVKDAVGFDEKRGDSVNVVNASFAAEPEIPQAEVEVVPMWERPMVRDLAKVGGGVIVLVLLVLFVLRPLTRGLLPQSSGGRALLSGDTMSMQGGGGPVGAVAGPSGPKQNTAYEQQLTDARTLVQQDPQRAAQIVKGWVSSDE
jgi:flagellar M-ring protein FliF